MSATAVLEQRPPAPALAPSVARPSWASAALDDIAELATDCLRMEVETWPKPGLVSDVDCGSHVDMDVETFHRSIDALRPFLRGLAQAGALGSDMKALRRIGVAAEDAMLVATGGVNTHRGAIFGLGLLCAAAGAKAAGLSALSHSLGQTVASRWGDEIRGGVQSSHSHGQEVWRRYGAGGARDEAATGFPTLYGVGVPALRMARAMAPDDEEAARVQACFALIARLEDTNLLHRGGSEGLRFAQRRAQGFLDRGGVGTDDWRGRAHRIHREFVARRLSPGGSADLLAMSLFVWIHESGAC